MYFPAHLQMHSSSFLSSALLRKLCGGGVRFSGGPARRAGAVFWEVARVARRARGRNSSRAARALERDAVARGDAVGEALLDEVVVHLQRVLHMHGFQAAHEFGLLVLRDVLERVHRGHRAAARAAERRVEARAAARTAAARLLRRRPCRAQQSSSELVAVRAVEGRVEGLVKIGRAETPPTSSPRPSSRPSSRRRRRRPSSRRSPRPWRRRPRPRPGSSCRPARRSSGPWPGARRSWP